MCQTLGCCDARTECCVFISCFNHIFGIGPDNIVPSYVYFMILKFVHGVGSNRLSIQSTTTTKKKLSSISYSFYCLLFVYISVYVCAYGLLHYVHVHYFHKLPCGCQTSGVHIELHSNVYIYRKLLLLRQASASKNRKNCFV